LKISLKPYIDIKIFNIIESNSKLTNLQMHKITNTIKINKS